MFEDVRTFVREYDVENADFWIEVNVLNNDIVLSANDSGGEFEDYITVFENTKSETLVNKFKEFVQGNIKNAYEDVHVEIGYEE